MIGEDVGKAWAEFGLAGLVIGTLFTLIFLFVRMLSKKDSTHQTFVKELLASEREERVETRKENATNAGKLASAIDDLTKSLREK